MHFLPAPIRKTIAVCVIFAFTASNAWAVDPYFNTATSTKIQATERALETAAPKISSVQVAGAQGLPGGQAAGKMAAMSAQSAPAAAPAALIAAPAYTINLIASTQQVLNGAVPVSLGLPSINNSGKVAMTAQYAAGDTRTALLNNYDQGSFPISVTSKFPILSPFVQANDLDQVAIQDHDSAANLVSGITRLDTKGAGTYPTMAIGAYSSTHPRHFNYVYPYTTINNKGMVAFDADDFSNNSLIASHDSGGTSTPINLGPVVAGPVPMFPMIADNGTTVVQYGGNNSAPLVISNGTFSQNFIMASTTNTAGLPSQFTAIGNKPGISDDGQMFAFLGQHSTLGQGLFLFFWDGSTWRGPALVVPLPSPMNVNYRVGVNKTSASPKQYTLVFMADSGTRGLYSVVADITNPNLVDVSNASALAIVGNPVPQFGHVVQDVNIYDPVNTKGQVAFWIKSTTGVQAIFRMNPTPAAGAITQAPANNPSCEADPVFGHSGQFEYGCTDIVIPGLGMDLAVNHTYKGQTAQVSQFGYGWSLSYNERLTMVGANAQIAGGGGRVDVYTLTAGQYKAPAGLYQTLVKNADNSWTLTHKDGLVKTFDQQGRLTAIKDRKNNTITMQYTAGKVNIRGPDGIGGRMIIGSDYQLNKITGDNGRFVNLTYNGEGLLASIQDPSTSRTVTFAYDPITNDLLKITKPASAQFPAGIDKVFTYDANHNILTIKDGKGQVFVTNVYNSLHKVTQQTNGSGTYTFAYAQGRTFITDRKGFKYVHEYNAAGNPTRTTIMTTGLRPTDPASFETFKTFNADMELTSVTYPNGNGVKYVYDSANANARARGNLLQVRRKLLMSAPDNNTNDLLIRYTYEPQFNQVKTIIDALNKVTTFTYDYELPTSDPSYGTQGNLVKITQPAVAGGSPVTQFSYNASGQPLSITDPNGNATHMVYDSVTGYLTAIVQDPAGVNASTQFAYDAFGNVRQITDPNGRITSNTYNELGWLISTTNPLGRISKYTYDANGNVIKEENQLGAAFQTTTYAYDVLNHPVTITDPLNRVTTMTYDANENLATVKDPRNNVTTYTYDERDMIFKVTDANGGVTQYDYDPNGNLKTITDAKGNKTNYTYGNFDNLKSTVYANGNTEQYSYNKNLLMTQKITPNNQTINYTYDAINRLTAISYPADASINVTRSYDLGGRLKTANTTAANLTFVYDKLGRVAIETVRLNGINYSIKSAYDKAGNRVKVTYPSGKFVSYVYNELNQIRVVRMNNINLATYAYDQLNRVSIKNLWAGQTYNSVFKYDNANQTKSITHKITQTGAKIASNTYVYDTAGNRIRDIQVDAAGASRTLNYVYNKLYELTSVTGAQAHSYAYDKVGNRTAADGVTYATNNVNQYTNVGGTGLTYDNNGNLLTEGLVTYTYDAENRLRSVQNSNTYTFKYDALNRRVSKAMNGSVLQYFVNDGDQLIEEYSGANALVADYTHGTGIDEVLTMTKGGETYYYVYDALGNVKSYLTAGGVSSGIIEYDPFGKPMPVTIGNPILFTGRYYDIETGLYYYRARYYNPTLGRFLQRDPIGYFDSMNLYQYVNNNPINYIDPTGQWIQFLIPVLVGAGVGFSTNAIIELIMQLQGGECGDIKIERIMNEGLFGGIVGALGGGFLGIQKLFKILKLINAGRELDAADKLGKLTKAGRGLEKHGGREGSVFPKATGDASSKNAQGQKILNEIVSNPKSQTTKNKGGGIDIYAPDGRGARFRSDGSFGGFLEP